ncbi:hypothetical protein [Solirubrobacter soli]|uniref:hypothetical protein n=1 Tax=Solirubrobacter soli TaxID=363832 RepID=UPI0004223080|nr:hypothetical protein [Solirubrobacter soli]
MRLAVTLLCLLAGALVAPASGSAFPAMSFDNQCQYSYDGLWRPVPMVFSGKLTDAGGTELANDAKLAVGDKVVLRDGTVSAVLPSWIPKTAYDFSMIGPGDTDLPVRAWLALEATNTAEGVTAPIALDTVARAHIELLPSGEVDEQRSSLIVIAAPFAPVSWTATGGEVQVRQALGESLPPLPIGRNGNDVRVRGSLYVEASLASDAKLFLDCLQATQELEGGTFGDVLPGALSVFAVPGWTGAVDGAPLADRVDADLTLSRVPPRVGNGQEVSFGGATLRLRLTAAQRAAWLGSGGAATVTGGVVVHGARSAEASQTVPFSGTATVPADGPSTVLLPLLTSSWTATGTEGIDLSADRVISAQATVSGVTRTLTLTRVSAGEPLFARLLREPDPPTPIRTPVPTVVPTAVATPAPTPAPTVVPAPKPVAGVASVRSTKLKRSGTRVPVVVRCAGQTACRGTLRLKRTVALTASAKYTVAAGKSATVRLALSSAGRALLRKHAAARVRAELRQAGGKLVVRSLTLRR